MIERLPAGVVAVGATLLLTLSAGAGCVNLARPRGTGPPDAGVACKWGGAACVDDTACGKRCTSSTSTTCTADTDCNNHCSNLPTTLCLADGPTSFTDSFDSMDSTSWTYTTCQTGPVPDPLGTGNNTLRNDSVPEPCWKKAGFSRVEYSLVTGMVAQWRFQLENDGFTGTVSGDSAYMGIRSNDGLRLAMIAGANGLTVIIAEYDDGVTSGQPNQLLTETLTAHTWYVGRILLHDTDGFTLEYWQEDNHALRGSYTRAMPAGRSWRFEHELRGGSRSYLDDYREYAAGTGERVCGTTGGVCTVGASQCKDGTGGGQCGTCSNGGNCASRAECARCSSGPFTGNVCTTATAMADCRGACSGGPVPGAACKVNYDCSRCAAHPSRVCTSGRDCGSCGNNGANDGAACQVAADCTATGACADDGAACRTDADCATTCNNPPICDTSAGSCLGAGSVKCVPNLCDESATCTTGTCNGTPACAAGATCAQNTCSG